MNEYDYIIAGSGCSGLSLLYRLLTNQTLRDKQILVIDQDLKNKNDRTWCYWEAGEGFFEDLVVKKWKNLTYSTENFKVESQMKRYEYKMIRGIDFYNHVLPKAKEFPNVRFVQETLESIHSDDEKAVLKTTSSEYTAKYVFNSTRINTPDLNASDTLLQHFEGWVIRLEEPFFDQEKAILMDFSVGQENGTTFVYVLPMTDKEALVEYTFFSEHILEKEKYHAYLSQYLADILGERDYEITHKEFGIVPMSLTNLPVINSANKRVINIGTSGGFTRASTGYTFQNIQKKTAEIVANLEANRFPKPQESFREKMYQWYDKTFLDVLLSKKMGGKEALTHMFKKVDFESILAFLGGESSFGQELRIMSSVPLAPFLGSGLKQLIKFNS
ncbi:MAG: lycopene cyclase family protein [Bacteroidota bacterium]